MSTVRGASLALVLAVGAVGCGGREAGPENAWKAFQAALVAKDSEKAWSLLSSDTQTYFENAAKRARDSASSESGGSAWAEFLECSPKDVAGMTGKKVFAAHVERMDRASGNDKIKPKNYIRELRDVSKIYDIVVKLNEAEAKVTVDEEKKLFNTIYFKSEGSTWKVKPQEKYVMWPIDT